MIKQICANAVFELRIRARSISSYVYFGMFFALAALMTLAAGGAFGGVTVSFGTGGRVFVNAPLSISFYVAFLTSLNLFIIAPVFGQAVCKDFVNDMEQIVFSTPLQQGPFLLGRFLGAFLFMSFVLASVPLGVALASSLPLVLPSAVGPQVFSAYVYSWVAIAWPSLFIFGALFFLVGARTQKMVPIYIGATLLFLLWSISGQLLKEIDNKWIATLVDPMGLQAMGENIRYWTVHQQNTQFVSWSSYFLWNRLLWLGLGGVALALSLGVFSPQRRRGAATAVLPPEEPLDFSAISLPSLQRQLKIVPLLRKQIAFEFSSIVKSIYFLVILLAGVGYMFVVGTQVGKLLGTNTYPVTYNVIEFLGGTFSLFMLIIITLYVGESLWRDRDLKMDQIVNALPVPTGVLLSAKYVAVALLTAVLLLAVIVAGAIVQLAYGYTHFEWGLYFKDLYLLKFPSYLNIIALTFFIQIVARNKYLGHGLVILYYVFDTFASTWGFEHFLYRFGSAPLPMYSDMNGYGHFFRIFHLYNTYWLCLSVVLLVVSYLLWTRGTLEGYKLASLRASLRRRWNGALVAVTAVALLGFVSLGSYLFYQTNVVNTYLTKKDKEKLFLQYERDYKKYEQDPVLEVTSVKAQVDLFPARLAMQSRLEMAFKNGSGKDIQRMLVHFPREALWTMTFSVPVKIAEQNEDLGLVVYELEKPLAPHATLTAVYEVRVDRSSIKNDANTGSIYFNGTFFNNFDFFPRWGYVNSMEITSRKTREKYGLSPKPRMPAIDSQEEHGFTYIARSNSWLDFEATVSTEPDQIAIAPGYLQKEWEENGRRYFHYKMDQKILNFYAFLSGRYEVRRDRWNDVNIEIYYHKGHEYNLDRMVRATQESLDYFTQNFGPYQHKQFRIIEFPRYASFAQAFPNTIPYSERVGFIAKVDDANPDDIDYAYYITAHELAHQWWAHQLIGANVQGAEMLSESFSQYAALMVMEKRYGRDKMKRFLKHELDTYLFGRGQEGEYENPIYLTEGQPYIHYNKGSLLFYAIKEYLGEDTLNGALREMLQTYGTKKAPYPTTREFIAILKKRATPEQQKMVEDFLEKIVLFENRPLTAQAKKITDDEYEVELTVSAKKIYADKEGQESEAAFIQDMDIGVLDKDGNFIYLQRHKIRDGENKISVRVTGLPAKAGIDPRNVLIDRNSKDNIMNISVQ